MNPVNTMKGWAHEHHAFTMHEAAFRLSQWSHGEKFWPVVGLVLALGFLVLMVFMGVNMDAEKLYTIAPVHPYPFYWAH